ncbi:hypothetical protein [Marinicella sp. W31]|uniref:hypothetical protein n=1 Tax=Marinicella sp. W31 TaxID=3023713 RepID=UPI00375661CB
MKYFMCNKRLCFVFLLIPFYAQGSLPQTPQQGVSYITIGNDSNCDLNTSASDLQDAINANVDEIRMTNTVIFSMSTSLTIGTGNPLSLVGGFDNCNLAASNIVSSTPSVIENINNNINTIDIIRDEVKFSNLIIKNGNSVIALSGNSVNLELDKVEIVNASDFGLMAQANAGQIFMKDSRFYNNETAVLCNGNLDVYLVGNSHINDNDDGVRISNGCEFTMVMGDDPTGGIYNNSVNTTFGTAVTIASGGTFIGHGGTLEINGETYGNNTIPLSVRDNVGSLGGAFYLASGDKTQLPVLSLYGVSLTGNSASSGGAIYANNNARVTIDKPTGGCGSRIGCNSIIGNTATNAGGAMVFTLSAKASIKNAHISQNKSPTAAALFVGAPSTEVELETSLIDANGLENNGSDSIIKVNNGGDLSIVFSTINDNFSSDTLIENNNSNLTLKTSYLYNVNTAGYYRNLGNSTLVTECLLVDAANNTSSPEITLMTVNQYAIEFVDPLSGNYRLSTESLAIDRCAAINPIPSQDIDGDLRGIDDPNIIDLDGIYDIGFDESLLFDVIFVDGFE